MTEEPISKKMKLSNLKIGTHSGTFHADESLAVYMLRLLPKFKDAQVIRSRDNEVLEECDIIVDVTGKYDGVKHFDHHQREFNDTFDNDKFKTRLSSAGLVYKHFGKEIISTVLGESDIEAPVVSASYQRVYTHFVEAIDANDNGINEYDPAVIDAVNNDSSNEFNLKPRFINNTITLPSVVSRLNPLQYELTPIDNDKEKVNKLYDEKFEAASKFMGEAFVRMVMSVGKDWFPAKQTVLEAYQNRSKETPQILVIDGYTPWKSHLHDLEEELGVAEEDKVLYVLFPGGDSWRVAAVSVSPSSFVSRKALPEAWRGLRDEELSKVSGIDGCVFVHASGFIGGNKTKEGALAMAIKAVSM